jgi:hypothetical protein
MTQEQMERAINFVVQHHAQFAADIQQLKEAQVVTEQQLQQLMKTQAEAQAGNEARFAQMIKAQAEGQAAYNKRFAETNEAIAALTALAGRGVKDQERTEKKLAGAEERWRVSINETNECLKGLILVVERYIHSRNGNGESHGG